MRVIPVAGQAPFLGHAGPGMYFFFLPRISMARKALGPDGVSSIRCPE
jgi:hypothetical protein